MWEGKAAEIDWQELIKKMSKLEVQPGSYQCPDDVTWEPDVTCKDRKQTFDKENDKTRGENEVNVQNKTRILILKNFERSPNFEKFCNTTPEFIQGKQVLRLGQGSQGDPGIAAILKPEDKMNWGCEELVHKI